MSAPGLKTPHDGASEVGDRHPNKKDQETRTSKLKRTALGVMLLGIAVLMLFLAWGGIFWALGYLVGWW